MLHTPGTWKVQSGFLTVYTTSDPKSGTGLTQAIASPNKAQAKSPEEAEANAHLIAAAPEMLEALKGCLAWLDDMGIKRGEVMNRMAEAIAKAEGNLS